MSDARFRKVFYYLAPSWLTTGEGEQVLYSLGLLMDAYVERARQGLLSRFPTYASYALPTDSLSEIAKDRLIVRGMTETPEEYAVRAKQWLIKHAFRGHAFGMLRELKKYIGSGAWGAVATIDYKGRWHRVNADDTEEYGVLEAFGLNWYQGHLVHDADPYAFGQYRFWVLITPVSTIPWEPDGDWGDAGAWGDPGLFGLSGSTFDVATFNSIISRWKPAGTYGESVMLSENAVEWFNTTRPTGWASWSNRPRAGWYFWRITQ